MSWGGDIEPVIPPGYVPADSKIERSIWGELEEYERLIRQSALLIDDEPISDYVADVACRVAGPYCEDLRVYLIRNPNFNAFMTANGVMVIWTGLLIRMSSEDELAAVIGHELAHYTQSHTLKRFLRLKKNAAVGSVLDFGVAILTGVSTPAAQLGAAANAMSFNRNQEREADLLGVQFMAESGYDPHAAAKVWRTIVDEDGSADEKRRQPNIFTKTHPNPVQRVDTLEAFVATNYPSAAAKPEQAHRFVDVLNHYYMQLMEDQLDTARFGRTQAILRQHETMGVKQSLVQFFWGELYRQRNDDGDMELARQSYTLAAEGDPPVAEAHLNLGYIFLKARDMDRASDHFNQYLELEPEADDRAMIEFYLGEGGS